MSYFQKQGRALLGNGYLIVPIRRGEKRPALNNWQTARITAADLSTYANCGVGVLCGQGAHPIAAIDIDTTNAVLAERFTDWCRTNLGSVCERVGKAPKILIPYRAKEGGWRKAFSAWFDDENGEAHRVEVLGEGQQFVAYHIHPDTGEPYRWVDLVGGLEMVRADELPIISEEGVRRALAEFERMALEVGLTQRSRSACKAPDVPRERTPREDEDFFGRVNEAALAALGMWVPQLFPTAREYHDGYRVAQIDLGRNLQEDLSIVGSGIVDFGVADQGDERAGKRTPIDLVLEHATRVSDDIEGIPTSPYDAAIWLCECLDTPPEDLGLGLRRQREKAAERAAKRIALTALQDRAAECDDTIVLLDEIAKQARDVIAGTPALRAEAADVIKSRFRELTGKALPVADLNKALRETAPPTVRAKRPLTEFGNAERMLDQFGKGLMYVPEFGSWFCWTTAYWRRAQAVEIEHMAKEAVKALVNEIADHPEPAEFFKFCAISQQAKMVKNMVTLAQSDPRVMVPASELDKDSRYLGATNGVIDLHTGELLEPDPDMRITKVVGCDYVPGAKAPLFRQTVLEVFKGDEALTSFFQRLIGYAAMGEPKHDVLAIPFGNGSNGKSTVLGAVRDVFGGYARTADASTFVTDNQGAKNAGGAREDLLRLKGARFVYVSEPDENGELREGMVKSMTGGENITARGLYSKESIDFLPTWVVFMPTNHKPIVKGSDDGIWRRLMMIPFTRNFENDPAIAKDPDREQKLRAEMEGVLAWIVEGALAYQRQGLDVPRVVKDASKHYREQMDLLGEWLEDHCEVGDEYFAENNALWASWQEFAKTRGLLTYVKNSTSLGRRLDSRFVSVKVGGKRGRKGLRVRDDFESLV